MLQEEEKGDKVRDEISNFMNEITSLRRFSNHEPREDQHGFT